MEKLKWWEILNKYVKLTKESKWQEEEDVIAED